MKHSRLIEAAVGRGGEVSLRGLPPLVVAELLGCCSNVAGQRGQTGAAVLRDELRPHQVTRLPTTPC